MWSSRIVTAWTSLPPIVGMENLLHECPLPVSTCLGPYRKEILHETCQRSVQPVLQRRRETGLHSECSPGKWGFIATEQVGVRGWTTTEETSWVRGDPGETDLSGFPLTVASVVRHHLGLRCPIPYRGWAILAKLTWRGSC